ncbi:la protein homolog [Hetaerina americana]|uniref:la protein homolog n=1 Tax=Hetaerina americana TaxID=62018 RepID=UPI003A7F51B3
MIMEQTKEVGNAELDQKIVRQVEYYFGDFNLPRDKFLQEQIKLDDGWIPLTTMLNFKRLATLTTDLDIIADALKKSSKLIEVDGEKKKIRRSSEKPLPAMTESRMKEVQARTIYCKGFTKENATLDKLLEYFGQFGTVDNIQMRSYLDKATNEYIFKGSVFVLFATKEEAEEFLKKDTVEYEGVKLLTKRQEEYFSDKKKEREEKRKMQKAKVQQATNRQSQTAGQKSQDDDDKESDEEVEEKGSGFPRGALVYMKNVPKNATREDIKSAVASVWKKGAKEGEDTNITVAYVDYNMGDSEGWIRLAEADTAVTLVQRAKEVAESGKKSKSPEADEVNGVEKDKEKSKGDDAEEGGEASEKVMEEDVEEGSEKVMEEGSGDGEKDVDKDSQVSHIEVCDALVSIRVLKGSEEDEYLEKAKGAREKKLMSTGKNRKRGGHGGMRRGRGGRGGKRKHNWEGGPSHKRRH